MAIVGMIEVLRRLDLLSDHPYRELDEIAHPLVLGGGRPVGRLEVLPPETA